MNISSIIGSINTPGTPGLPEIPDINSSAGPSVADFEDFSTFTACMEKEVVFTAKSLKLQSIVLTSSRTIGSIRTILKAMMGMPGDAPFAFPGIPDINMDLSISRLTEPKINPLPKCLADTLTNSVNNGMGNMKDIMDPFNSALDGVNSLTSSASGVINGALNSAGGILNDGIGQVNKIMEKTMDNIVDPGDKELFVALEKFQSFIEDTGFVDTYREWKDIKKCLDGNCAPLKDYIYEDDFLYYDEKHLNFILPIDINSGRLRIQKFFEVLSKEEKKECNEIEKRYYKYLRDKQQVLYKAAQKAKKNKIKDSKNPFLKSATSMIESTTDTFNNLF